MSGFRLGRVGGVTIRAELSWLVVVALVGLSMVARTLALDGTGTGTGTGVAVAVGLAATVAFFGCLLLHELAHATVARRLGLPVKDITLFLFGGATRTGAEHRSPGQELAVTVVGPATSLLLAGTFGGVVVAVGAAGGPGPAGNVIVDTVGYLGWVNLALGLFNLLPAYPMDGGRLLRAALWQRCGDRDRATAQAVGVAATVAWGLIALGLFGVVGGAGEGLWPALIGWFLLQSARSERWRLVLRDELQQVPAGSLVRRRADVLDARLPVAEAVEGTAWAGPDAVFPVVDDTGGYAGLVTRAELVTAGRAAVPGERVGDLAGRIDDGPAADAGAPASLILDELAGPDAHVVVVSGSSRRVLGVVGPDELLAWARRRHGPDGAPDDVHRRRDGHRR